VRQVGHLPELYRAARSAKYKRNKVSNLSLLTQANLRHRL